MLKYIIVIFISLSCVISLHSQMRYFNKTIANPGPKEGRLSHVLTTYHGEFIDTNILVLGAHFIVQDDQNRTKGLFLNCDGSGNYQDYQYLSDSVQYPEQYLQSLFDYEIKDQSSIWTIVLNKNSVSNEFTRWLYEVNYLTGKASNRIELLNPHIDTLPFGISKFDYDKDRNKLLLSGSSFITVNEEVIKTPTLSLYDNDLNYINGWSINYDELEKGFRADVIQAKFLNSNRIAHISLVRNYRRESPEYLSNKFRYMEFDTIGNILVDTHYSELPAVRDNGNHTNPGSILLENGDWLLMLTKNYPFPSSLNQIHPIIIRMNSDFTDTVWTSGITENITLVAENRQFSLDFCLSHDSTSIMAITDIDSRTGEIRQRTSWIHKISTSNGDIEYSKRIEPTISSIDSVRSSSFESINRSPFGGYLISGNTGITKNYRDSSSYSNEIWLIHMDENGCFLPDCDSVDVTVEEFIDQKLEFLLYPNPSSDMLVLRLPNMFGLQGEEARLMIHDINGQLMLEKEISLLGDTEYILPISHYSAGSYVATLVIGDRRTSQVVEVVR